MWGIRQRREGEEEEEEDRRSFGGGENHGSSESWLSVLAEVTPPFLLAGLGMVGAGLVLDKVQYWSVFRDLPELFIMVPALLGLKGNLEMTLASRLSTHAHLGDLDTLDKLLKMGVANLALTQVQGVVVGALSALLAMLLAWVPDPSRLDTTRVLVMTATSVVTASLASLILGVVMIAVVAASRRYSINPDNVATPIAAALGDLVTLALLSLVASLLSGPLSLPLSLLSLGILSLLVTPLSLSLALQSPHTRIVLATGWTPVLAGMCISSLGGKVLNKAIHSFPNIAVFQPVINGVAGNLVGIQASRLSTSLHQTQLLPGTLPPYLASLPFSRLTSPLTTFSPSSCPSPQLATSATAAQVLLLLVIPGHLLFNLAIGLSQGFEVLSLSFIFLYVTAALLQVGSLLHLCHVMVPLMWVRAINPDNSAIPYLTALGDLVGGLGLAGVFILLNFAAS